MTLVIRSPRGKLRSVRLAGDFRSIDLMQIPTASGPVTAIVGTRCIDVEGPDECALLAIRTSNGKRLDPTALAARLGPDFASSSPIAVEGTREVRFAGPPAQDASTGMCAGTLTDSATGQSTTLPEIPDCSAPHRIQLRGSRLVLSTGVVSREVGDYDSGGRQYALDLAHPGAPWTVLGDFVKQRDVFKGSDEAVLLGDVAFDLYRHWDFGRDGEKAVLTTQVRRWALTQTPVAPAPAEPTPGAVLESLASTDRELLGLVRPRTGGKAKTRIVRIDVP